MKINNKKIIMQEKLNALYREYLKKILADDELKKQIETTYISSPLLINSETRQNQYLEMDFKILYVGQETRYWSVHYGKIENWKHESISDIDVYLKYLVSAYKDFDLGKNHRKPIFLFQDVLLNQIRQKHKNTGILWSNVLRHDFCEHGKGSYNCKVSPVIERKIAYDNNYILRKEIEILQPNAIVFLCGPNYDHILKNTFKDLQYKSVEKYTLREMAVLESKDLPCKAIRTYHPSGMKRKHWDEQQTARDIAAIVC